MVWSWTSQPTFKFGILAGDFMLAMNILLSGNNYPKIALLLRFMNMGVVSPSDLCRIQDTYCVDTIKEFWMESRSEAIQRLQGQDVVVIGELLKFLQLVIHRCQYGLLSVRKNVSLI